MKLLNQTLVWHLSQAFTPTMMLKGRWVPRIESIQAYYWWTLKFLTMSLLMLILTNIQLKMSGLSLILEINQFRIKQLLLRILNKLWSCLGFRGGNFQGAGRNAHGSLWTVHKGKLCKSWIAAEPGSPKSISKRRVWHIPQRPSSRWGRFHGGEFVSVVQRVSVSSQVLWLSFHSIRVEDKCFFQTTRVSIL